MTALSRWKHVSKEWAALSYYQRFESSVALVLGITYWLMRERDDRQPIASKDAG